MRAYFIFGLLFVGWASPLWAAAFTCDSPLPRVENANYFIGVSSGASNQGEGELQAQEQAKTQAAGYIGTSIKNLFHEDKKTVGDSNEGTTTYVNSSSRTKAVSDHEIKGMVFEKKSVTLDPETKLYQICVLGRWSKDNQTKSIAATNDRNKKRLEVFLRDMEGYLEQAKKLAQKRLAMAALGKLMQGQEAMAKAKMSTAEMNLARFQTFESKITGMIQLNAPNGSNLEFKKGATKLVVMASYGSGAIGNIPLALSFQDKTETRSSDGDGKVALTLEYQDEPLYLTAKIDTHALRGKISSFALNDLSGREQSFTVIPPRLLLPKKLKSSFVTKLEFSPEKTSYKVGEKVTMEFGCPQDRCYLMLFTFEKKGGVVLQLKTKKQAKGKIRKVSSKVTAGDASLFMIAALQKFPKKFNGASIKRKQKYSREEFMKLLDHLKAAGGDFAEKKLTMKVNQ